MRRSSCVTGEPVDVEAIDDVDARPPDRALGHLGQPKGMRECELDLPWARAGTEEAAFEMQRHRVVPQQPTPLGVEEERVADVVEVHLVAVAKRIDRRIVAGPAASPRSEQEGERLDVRMQRRLRHRATLSRGSQGPPCQGAGRSR